MLILVDNQTNDPVTGTFAGLPEGARLILGGLSAQITYTGGDGDDVALFDFRAVPIPEPSGALMTLALAAAAGAAGLRRRRR